MVYGLSSPTICRNTWEWRLRRTRRWWQKKRPWDGPSSTSERAIALWLGAWPYTEDGWHQHRYSDSGSSVDSKKTLFSQFSFQSKFRFRWLWWVFKRQPNNSYQRLTMLFDNDPARVYWFPYQVTKRSSRVWTTITHISIYVTIRENKMQP